MCCRQSNSWIAPSEVNFDTDKSFALQLFTDTVIPAEPEQTQDMEVE